MPTGGLLRPIVHCQTNKYNMRVRAGRGFTLQEIRSAGISPKYAQSIGICVDHRRRNRSLESVQANVQRLKEYQAKVVILPKREASTEAQLKGFILPIAKADMRDRARKATEEEKKSNVFQSMRIARADARMIGVRQRIADEKAA